MFQFFKRSGFIFLAAVIACSTVGCKCIYSKPEETDKGFTKDTTFDWVGTVRQKDKAIEPFGVSSKAKEIEQHLGGM